MNACSPAIILAYGLIQLNSNPETSVLALPESCLSYELHGPSSGHPADRADLTTISDMNVISRSWRRRCRCRRHVVRLGSEFRSQLVALEVGLNGV